MIRTRHVVATVSTAALVASLGACKPEHPAAPTASTIPALGPLDPTAGVPAYAPLPVPADDAYAYPQRAYGMSRTIHQRPPSYAFGYGGEEPWAWDEGDEGTMVAEPIDDGYRYYYYAPDATYPYFVQDPGYGYAYSPDGVLVGLFAATGALIAADRWRDEAPYAATYWNRGYDLDRARHGGRRPVPPGVWRARAPALYAGPERWFQAAQAQGAWRGEGHRAQPWRAAARPAVAVAGDFRGPPRAAPHIGPSQVRIEHGEPRHDAGRRPGPERGHGSAGPGPHVQPHGPGSKGGDAPMAWREAHAGGQPHPGRAPGHRAGQGGQAFAHVPQPHGGNPPGGSGNHGAPHGWSHGGGGQGNGGHGGGGGPPAVRVSQAHGPGGGSGHGGVNPGHGGAGHGNPGHGNPGQGKAGHGGGGGHGRH
jgi:hypothetical protein